MYKLQYFIQKLLHNCKLSAHVFTLYYGDLNTIGMNNNHYFTKKIFIQQHKQIVTYIFNFEITVLTPFK